MEINKNGQVIDSKIFKSVINSKIQMTYNKVYSILEENANFDEYEPFVGTLNLMMELASILISKKANQGSMDFNMPEARILLDENDAVIDIKLRKMTIANKIIEEFMVVANETVAEKFNKIGIPFIYRVHEHPELDRIEKLNVFLTNLNYPTVNKLDNLELKKVMDLAKGKEEEKLVSLMVLRTMQLAKYSNENIGHFVKADNIFTLRIECFTFVFNQTFLDMIKTIADVFNYAFEPDVQKQLPPEMVTRRKGHDFGMRDYID
jgi:ribonuclease R